MEVIDALGKQCPIPVIEAKKALEKQDIGGILVKVDNIVAVQNLEKLASSYGGNFSFVEKGKNSFEVTISLNGKNLATPQVSQSIHPANRQQGGLTVVISRNTMGAGEEELGKILIKGFIYSLTELPIPPAYVIFLNSGVYLTSNEANTVNDLKKLAEKGTRILSCGTCVNYYGLENCPAVGSITDMFGITEKMASASNVINI